MLNSYELILIGHWNSISGGAKLVKASSLKMPRKRNIVCTISKES